jgi:hypothetical protein
MTAQETLERISALARDETEGQEALKLRALELIGKHHGLFAERRVHEFTNIAELLAEGLARADEDDNAEAKRGHRSTEAREIRPGRACPPEPEGTALGGEGRPERPTSTLYPL